MLKKLLQRWADWVGDRSLELAIHAELRRQEYAVHAAHVRDFRLYAIERPGWVQVHRFRVETSTRAGDRVVLFGAIRDDGRRERPEILLSKEQNQVNQKLAAWSDGLIRHRSRGA